VPSSKQTIAMKELMVGMNTYSNLSISLRTMQLASVCCVCNPLN
jgi:hypothetical protein